MAFYDRSAKWLMGHHGKSLLWLGGEHREIISCQAVQAEVVLPAKLPDGLFEVEFADSSDRELHLLEVFVYPDRRAVDQLVRDLELVHADRGEVPEISVLSLRPKGRYRIPNSVTLTSRRGTTSTQVKWRPIELWHIAAADLLARNDPGLIPWVPLCHTRRSPKSLLTECRLRIEQLAPQEEQEALLATTYVYADLRFDDEAVLKILGERKVLADTPLIQEFINEGRVETRREDTLAVIEARFGAVPAKLSEKLEQIKDLHRLSELHQLALTCENIEIFKRELK